MKTDKITNSVSNSESMNLNGCLAPKPQIIYAVNIYYQFSTLCNCLLFILHLQVLALFVCGNHCSQFINHKRYYASDFKFNSKRCYKQGCILKTTGVCLQSFKLKQNKKLRRQEKITKAGYRYCFWADCLVVFNEPLMTFPTSYRPWVILSHRLNKVCLASFVKLF